MHENQKNNTGYMKLVVQESLKIWNSKKLQSIIYVQKQKKNHWMHITHDIRITKNMTF